MNSTNNGEHKKVRYAACSIEECMLVSLQIAPCVLPVTKDEHILLWNGIIAVTFAQLHTY